MDLTLRRKEYRPDGIFGELVTPTGEVVAVTLEHAYQDGEDYVPKIPIGTFVCQIGEHQLPHMTHPFTTFEITGVEGHTDLLFHSGNFNDDSSGCVLVGTSVAQLSDGLKMITASRTAFENFMALQANVTSFNLTVIA